MAAEEEKASPAKKVRKIGEVVEGWSSATKWTLPEQLLLVNGGAGPRHVLELGVFMGDTTRVLLEHTPATTRITSVDLWDNDHLLASPQYNTGRIGSFMHILETRSLWDTFMHHVGTPNKARVTPMRMDTVAAMRKLRDDGVTDVDFILIDADNSEEGTYNNITTAAAIWPRAHIVGMLLMKSGVRKALQRACQELRRTAYAASTEIHRCNVWSFTPCKNLSVPVDSVRHTPESLIQQAMRYDNKEMFATQFARMGVTYEEIAAKKMKTYDFVAAQLDAVGILAYHLDELGTDVEARRERSQNTLLIHAAYYGATQCVDLLLRRGADHTRKNKWGETAADAARKRGHTETLALLSACGTSGTTKGTTGIRA